MAVRDSADPRYRIWWRTSTISTQESATITYGLFAMVVYLASAARASN